MSDGRAVRASDSQLSDVTVEGSSPAPVRADTCLVWDRWRYPVSRATRYTLFKAPNWAKYLLKVSFTPC